MKEGEGEHKIEERRQGRIEQKTDKKERTKERSHDRNNYMRKGAGDDIMKTRTLKVKGHDLQAMFPFSIVSYLSRPGKYINLIPYFSKCFQAA